MKTELNQKATPSKRGVAVVMGLSIVVMALAAGVVMSLVMNDLLAIADEVEMQRFFKSNLLKIQWAVPAWLLILLCDVLFSWGVLHYFKNKCAPLTQLTATFRFLYSAILAVAILFLVLSISCYYLNMPYLVLCVNGFQAAWSFGLIVFGLHLLGLSRLVYYKNWLSILFSLLLFLGGLGYMVVHLGKLFGGTGTDTLVLVETILMLPMILGEVGYGIWLLVKGGKNLDY